MDKATNLCPICLYQTKMRFFFLQDLLAVQIFLDSPIHRQFQITSREVERRCFMLLPRFFSTTRSLKGIGNMPKSLLYCKSLGKTFYKVTNGKLWLAKGYPFIIGLYKRWCIFRYTWRKNGFWLWVTLTSFLQFAHSLII